MPELDGPGCARELLYLLEWFAELSSARGAGVAGPNPISYAELAAWSALTGNDPTQAEVRILRRIDAAFLSALSRSVKSG